MAFMLTKVRCRTRKNQLSYRAFGVIHQGDFQSPIAISLKKNGVNMDIFLRVDCPQKNERAAFDHFCGFAEFRNARLSCVTPHDPEKPTRVRLSFGLIPRNRTFRECLSIMEETIKSADQTLSLIH